MWARTLFRGVVSIVFIVVACAILASLPLDARSVHECVIFDLININGRCGEQRVAWFYALSIIGICWYLLFSTGSDWNAIGDDDSVSKK